VGSAVTNAFLALLAFRSRRSRLLGLDDTEEPEPLVAQIHAESLYGPVGLLAVLYRGPDQECERYDAGEGTNL
jgi:hypothetical protein